MFWYDWDRKYVETPDPIYCRNCKRGFTKDECDRCKKLHEEESEEDE